MQTNAFRLMLITLENGNNFLGFSIVKKVAKKN